MDEPTASLTEREVDAALRRHRASCAAQAPASSTSRTGSRRSPRSPIASPCCATARPWRHGAAPSVDRAELIRLMVGRELSAVFPKRRGRARRRRARGPRAVASRRAGSATSRCTVRRGEILGLAGLVGSGRTELARNRSSGCAGRRGRDPGSAAAGVTIALAARTPSAPASAYVPEDRRQHGVVLEMSVAANTSLASLRRVSRARPDRSRGASARAAQDYVERLRIKTPSVSTPTSARCRAATSRRSRWRAGSRSIPRSSSSTSRRRASTSESKAEIHGLMGLLAERAWPS